MAARISGSLTSALPTFAREAGRPLLLIKALNQTRSLDSEVNLALEEC